MTSVFEIKVKWLILKELYIHGIVSLKTLKTQFPETDVQKCAQSLVQQKYAIKHKEGRIVEYESTSYGEQLVDLLKAFDAIGKFTISSANLAAKSGLTEGRIYEIVSAETGFRVTPTHPEGFDAEILY